ncbi:thylakoid lumenal 15.0 kDa protein 2, chloroplastic [Telopea speciosissima]|uniref:thylakoid lumenal 15.0 kDa protein 2, chloroplastic n=1 Tax=Telopea speciosissima TaxID=54955 RepID=UPI001CC43A78|nr:thylakoid lumenal 15.0 kDa protein 2, chloroplastic [Telopea speciosissima]
MALVFASSLKLGSCISSRRTHQMMVRPVAVSSSSPSYASIRNAPTSSFSFNRWVADLPSKSLNFALSGALMLGLSLTGVGFAEAKVGVNKPELLPKEFSVVIDVAGFLSDGQEKRLAQEIANLEKDTGFKLRVLAQNYPETPGLAVRDFWQVDDRTVVFVADPTFGNILNFNVGESVDLEVPRSFWSRLAGKYGNMFYWKEKGEDASIEAAVMAISNCLREPAGSSNCSEIK